MKGRRSSKGQEESAWGVTAILHSQRRPDGGEFKQKLEVGKQRGRLVLAKDHSGQKEEQVQHRGGNPFKGKKGGQ